MASRNTERDPAAAAREICLRLLSARARTRVELAQALAARGISDEVAEAVLNRYGEVGLVDDAAFAEAYVRSAQQQHRGLGRKALRADLQRRGVAEEVTTAAVAEVDRATEEATARALVQRKLRTMGDVAPQATLRRLMGMLGRKGYAEGLAWRVVRDEIHAVDLEADGRYDTE